SEAPAFGQTVVESTAPTVWDAQFMSRALSLARTEIDESRVVLRESRDPSLRRFAYEVGRAWSFNDSRLKAMALRKGLPATAPSMEAGRRQLGELSGARGTRIVADYTRDQVALHREAVRLFWDEAKNGGDPYIRNLASVTVPQLRHHLAYAQHLALR
ncbi:MAG: DUF4142 domain-containing protein, partial [Vulcanimicrobiaceae bacterium]